MATHLNEQFPSDYYVTSAQSDIRTFDQASRAGVPFIAVSLDPSIVLNESISHATTTTVKKSKVVVSDMAICN